METRTTESTYLPYSPSLLPRALLHKRAPPAKQTSPSEARVDPLLRGRGASGSIVVATSVRHDIANRPRGNATLCAQVVANVVEELELERLAAVDPRGPARRPVPGRRALQRGKGLASRPGGARPTHAEGVCRPSIELFECDREERRDEAESYEEVIFGRSDLTPLWSTGPIRFFLF